MVRLILLLCAAAAVVLGVVIARSLPSPDQQAVRYRQALMTVIDGTASPLMLMARAEAPYDPALVRRRAAELPVLAGMIADAFARNTSAARKLQSAALPYVWTDHAAFVSSAQRLEADALALKGAAAGADEVRIAAAINALGDECARCHRRFRAR